MDKSSLPPEVAETVEVLALPSNVSIDLGDELLPRLDVCCRFAPPPLLAAEFGELEPGEVLVEGESTVFGMLVGLIWER